MTLNILPGVPIAGTLSLTFVPIEGFDPTAPDTAIATGATAVTAQCLIMGGSYTGVAVDVNRIRKSRACSTVPYYIKGEKQFNLDRISVIYDPQDPSADISAAKAALVEDTEWYMIERFGKDGQTTLEDGDYVDIYQVQVVEQNKQYSDEEGAEATVDILLNFTGQVYRDVLMGGGES